MTPLDRVPALPIWAGEGAAAPLAGGVTNSNFLVQDGTRRVFMRRGDAIPAHQVLRFNEHAASRAAERAGISPCVFYQQAGVPVIGRIVGATMTAADLCMDAPLDPAPDLVARAHRDMPHHLRGPALMFRLFPVIRDHAATLRGGHSLSACAAAARPVARFGADRSGGGAQRPAACEFFLRWQADAVDRLGLRRVQPAAVRSGRIGG